VVSAAVQEQYPGLAITVHSSFDWTTAAKLQTDAAAMGWTATPPPDQYSSSSYQTSLSNMLAADICSTAGAPPASCYIEISSSSCSPFPCTPNLYTSYDETVGMRDTDPAYTYEPGLETLQGLLNDPNSTLRTKSPMWAVYSASSFSSGFTFFLNLGGPKVCPDLMKKFSDSTYQDSTLAAFRSVLNATEGTYLSTGVGLSVTFGGLCYYSTSITISAPGATNDFLNADNWAIYNKVKSALLNPGSSLRTDSSKITYYYQTTTDIGSALPPSGAATVLPSLAIAVMALLSLV